MSETHAQQRKAPVVVPAAVPAAPTRADYRGPSLIAMAASTCGLYPLTGLQAFCLYDAAVTGIVGLLCCLAPRAFVGAVNALAAWASLPAALVVRSDTSLLLLKAAGAGMFAYAAAVPWRVAVRNDREGGASALLVHKAAFVLLLGTAYATGGPTHVLLLPVIAHAGPTAAGLLWACPPTGCLKALTQFASIQHVA
jgi:hypothetical protein